MPTARRVSLLEFKALNKDASPLVPGHVVAMHSSGVGVVLASFLDNTKNAVGLSLKSTPASSTGLFATNGPFTLADWTAITGSVSLAAKAKYFLSSAGLLTAAPTYAPGNVAQLVGYSIDPQTLLIDIEDSVIKA